MSIKHRKAFTITELVIVIAVVAILAAILIPTFSNVIEQANVSSDTSVVRNINTALYADETLNGKPTTMQDVLKVALSEGYSVENLTPVSNGDIVWDQVSNRFALVKDGNFVYKDSATKSELGYKFWKITDNVEETSTGEYSYFLSAIDVSAIPATGLAVSTGIDVGDNQNISILYSANDAREVIFNTNGGTLTIDGPQSNVSHYGTATLVEITAVASQSYHEFGVVLGNLSIAQGRVVLESQAKVPAVVITTTAENFTADTIAVIDNSDNNTTVVATDAIVAENLSTVVTGTENVMTDVADSEAMSLFAGGVGTATSPYLIENQAQLLRMKQVVDGDSYYKLIKDITLTVVLKLGGDSNCRRFLDMNGHTVTYSATTSYTAGYIVLMGSAQLTIDGNGTFDFDQAYIDGASNGRMFETNENSKLVLKSGTFKSGLTCVLADGDSVCEIYGGYFTAMATYGSGYWLLNLQDNTNAKINVYGGTFDKYNPAASTTENPVANFVADGHEAVRQDGPTSDEFTYIVTKSEN